MSIELVDEESVEDLVAMRTDQGGIFMRLQSMTESKENNFDAGNNRYSA